MTVPPVSDVAKKVEEKVAAVATHTTSSAKDVKKEKTTARILGAGTRLTHN